MCSTRRVDSNRRMAEALCTCFEQDAHSWAFFLACNFFLSQGRRMDQGWRTGLQWRMHSKSLMDWFAPVHGQETGNCIELFFIYTSCPVFMLWGKGKIGSFQVFRSLKLLLFV